MTRRHTDPSAFIRTITGGHKIDKNDMSLISFFSVTDHSEK